MSVQAAKSAIGIVLEIGDTRRRAHEAGHRSDNGDAGLGGSGGGGVFLALGGTFTNVADASAFGGNAGTTPITNICAGGFVSGPGRDGLINFGRAVGNLAIGGRCHLAIRSDF